MKNNCNFFVFSTLILVFVLINLILLYLSSLKEGFRSKEGLNKKLKIKLASKVLKKNIFDEKNCLDKEEIKKKIHEQIDNYYSMYKMITKKDKICFRDLEDYIMDV